MHQSSLKHLYIRFTQFPLRKFFPCNEQVFHRNDRIIRMSKLNPRHPVNATPPPRLLPLLQNIKTAYILWYRYYQALPKIHRYSLGQRTDKLFIEIMEMVSIAA